MFARQLARYSSESRWRHDARFYGFARGVGHAHAYWHGSSGSHPSMVSFHRWNYLGGATVLLQLGERPFYEAGRRQHETQNSPIHDYAGSAVVPLERDADSFFRVLVLGADPCRA